jgi:hypothetical protein
MLFTAHNTYVLCTESILFSGYLIPTTFVHNLPTPYCTYSLSLLYTAHQLFSLINLYPSLCKLPTSHSISVYHFYTKYSALYFVYCNFSYCCLSIFRNFVSLAASEGVMSVLHLSQFFGHLELLQDLLSSKELSSSCTIFHNLHTWNVTTIICSPLVQINSGADKLTVYIQGGWPSDM